MSSLYEMLQKGLDEPEEATTEPEEAAQSETTTPPVEAAEAESQSEPAESEPAAATVPFISIDALLPDDPELPPSLRGKPVHDLIKDRNELVAKAHKAGFDANQLETLRARLAVQEAAMTVLRSQQAATQQKPAAAADIFTEAGVDPERDILADPRGLLEKLTAGIEQRVAKKYEEQLLPLQQKVSQAEVQAQAVRGQQAFYKALDLYNEERGTKVSKEQWDKAHKPIVDAVIQLRTVHPQAIEDPTAYLAAAKYFESTWGPLGGSAAPVAVPARAPIAGNPPTSGKPSSAAAPSNKHRLTKKQAEHVNRVLMQFPSLNREALEAEVLKGDE